MKRDKPPFPITPGDWLREVREAPPGCFIVLWIFIILAIIKQIFFK